MKKQRKFSFKGKVISSAQKTKNAGASYGYLTLPKGVKVFNVSEGTKVVRLNFLPYEITDPKHPEYDKEREVALPGTLWYRRPFKIHRNVGSTNDAVICLTSIGKKCPICEYQNKRFREKAEKQELQDLRAKSRSLYVVVPIDFAKHEEVPHIWDMADSLFQDTLLEELLENNENEDFFSLDNGKTAEVKFRWESLGGHPYPEARSISFEERDEIGEEILEEVPNLDTLLKIMSYDELSKKFFDLDDEEEGTGSLRTVEEEVEEEPVRTKRHIPPKPEEEEAEEDEVVEEKPTITRRRTNGVPPTKDKCPYGHKFGVDTNSFDDCDSCEIWDACIEQKEK